MRCAMGHWQRKWGPWMFTKYLDDLIAFAGLVCLISGIYLWLGLPAALILLGIILIYIGVRLDIRTNQHEPDKAISTPTTEIYPSQQ